MAGEAANSSVATWARVRHVLAIRLDALGDVLMTTPALRALKAGGAERRLSLLTSTSGAEIARLVPDVDDVIVYDPPWMKATRNRSDGRADLALAERLRQGGFDAAAVFTAYSQSPLPAALLCYLADIPLRLAHCHENPYQLLTDWVADPEPAAGIRHEVRRQLDLVATVGCTTPDERLSVRVPNAAREHAAALLRDLGLRRDQPWLVLHPGASAPSRRYPPDSYAEAGRLLAREDGCQVVLTGTEAEAPLVAHIQQGIGMPSWSLAGRLGIAELVGLISLAPLLIANNTGPAHIAAAVGTPVVDLYALTNPQHTPWGVPNRVLSHDVDCKYCYKSVCPMQHHNCLRLVPPEAVVAAARELLATQSLRE